MVKPHFPLLAILFLIILVGLVVLLVNRLRWRTERVESVTERRTLYPKMMSSPTATVYPMTMMASASPSSAYSLSDFMYPQATVSSQTATKLVLNSPDDPNVITTWYKNKITSSNFSARSFATTSSNGVVDNKLVGGSNSYKITVEIKKSATSKLTSIEVTQD